MKTSRAIPVITVCLLLALGCAAHADYMLLSPTATTLTTGQVRAEAALAPDSSDGRYYWLATGLQQYELTAIRQERPGLSAQNTFGIQFSFLPETSLSPAVAFGVSDVASQTSEGTGIYGAITKHIPLGPASIFVNDLEATVGIGAFGIRGPFGSVQAKLPMGMFVQGEYDSRDFNAAVGWQPIGILRVKAYTIRHDLFLGAEIVPISF